MAHISCPFSLDEYTLIVNETDALPWRSRCHALKALCLAHSFFVPLCQKRLYSRIVYSSRKVDAFLDILCDSPHLAGYVRHLEYYEFVDDSRLPVPIPQGNGNAVKFLDALLNLRSLAMVDAESPPGYDWKALDPQISRALLRIVLSPELRSLQLHGLRNFPVRGLAGLRCSANLTKLSVGALGVDLETLDVHFDGSDSGCTRARLVNLTAEEGSASAVRVLMGGTGASSGHRPVFDLNGLSIVSTEWGGGRLSDMGRVLVESVSHVQDLSCVLSRDSFATFYGLAASILKGPFKTIRKLRFRTRAIAENEEDPFYGSITELRQLAGQMPSLDTLDMCFHIYTRDVVDAPWNLPHAIEDALFPAFDYLLADGSAFPKLRSVSICFMLLILGDPPVDEEVEDRFRAFNQSIKDRALERLDAVSMFNFSFDMCMQPSILSADDA
ncbi:hypothetical protein BJ912DRAFT_243010 [Pholiota molesta]|nr:hypothetical protein BJ912DRAFT_243010 [Pholiota molesta]